MQVTAISGTTTFRIATNAYSTLNNSAVMRIPNDIPLNIFQLFSFTFTPPEDVENPFVELLTENIADSYIECNLVAWKLELGTTQTLAHKEDGSWRVNEVPTYAEQYNLCAQYSSIGETFLNPSDPNLYSAQRLIVAGAVTPSNVPNGQIYLVYE